MRPLSSWFSRAVQSVTELPTGEPRAQPVAKAVAPFAQAPAEAPFTVQPGKQGRQWVAVVDAFVAPSDPRLGAAVQEMEAVGAKVVIRQHEATAADPAPESAEDFEARLGGLDARSEENKRTVAAEKEALTAQLNTPHTAPLARRKLAAVEKWQDNAHRWGELRKMTERWTGMAPDQRAALEVGLVEFKLAFPRDAESVDGAALHQMLGRLSRLRGVSASHRLWTEEPEYSAEGTRAALDEVWRAIQNYERVEGLGSDAEKGAVRHLHKVVNRAIHGLNIDVAIQGLADFKGDINSRDNYAVWSALAWATLQAQQATGAARMSAPNADADGSMRAVSRLQQAMATYEASPRGERDQDRLWMALNTAFERVSTRWKIGETAAFELAAKAEPFQTPRADAPFGVQPARLEEGGWGLAVDAFAGRHDPRVRAAVDALSADGTRVFVRGESGGSGFTGAPAESLADFAERIRGLSSEALSQEGLALEVTSADPFEGPLAQQKLARLAAREGGAGSKEWWS